MASGNPGGGPYSSKPQQQQPPSMAELLGEIISQARRAGRRDNEASRLGDERSELRAEIRASWTGWGLGAKIARLDGLDGDITRKHREMHTADELVDGLRRALLDRIDEGYALIREQATKDAVAKVKEAQGETAPAGD